jgi:hypothetical protein
MVSSFQIFWLRSYVQFPYLRRILNIVPNVWKQSNYSADMDGKFSLRMHLSVLQHNKCFLGLFI